MLGATISVSSEPSSLKQTISLARGRSERLAFAPQAYCCSAAMSLRASLKETWPTSAPQSVVW